MAALAGNAAGEVLGPRPGKAACSFTQGVVECLLRVGGGVCSVIALAAGAVTVAFNHTSSGHTGITVAGSLCILAGMLGVAWTIVMVTLRYLNIGLLNIGSKYFLTTDVVVNAVLSLQFVVVGVVTAVFTEYWGQGDKTVFVVSIIAAVFCFISAIWLMLLALYMVVYISKDWNDKVIKYTLKGILTDTEL